MPDAVTTNGIIRRARPEDIPWMHEVAAKAYPDGTYEPAAAEAWMRGLLTRPEVLILRGERSIVVATIARTPWAPTNIDGYFLPVMSLGGSGRELIYMTKICLHWAKQMGATSFIFGATHSPTATDLGPLARRFGGVPACPNYVVEL